MTKPSLKKELNYKDKLRARSMSTNERNINLTNCNDYQSKVNKYIFSKMENMRDRTNLQQNSNKQKSLERKSVGTKDLINKNLQLHISKRLEKLNTKDKTDLKLTGIIGSGSTRIPTSSRVDSNHRSTQHIASF